VLVADPNNPARVRRPDYTRQPDYRARSRDPGPFVDKKDDAWTSVIHKTFETCAAGEPTWVIALHLRGSGIPRSSRAPDDEWTEEDVVKMMRNPIYRGEEVYRRSHRKQQFGPGKSTAVPTPDDQIWRRSAEHLRHVPDWLWHEANEALTASRSRQEYKKGAAHPLKGTQRDRRGALSRRFFCGICGMPMWRDGRRYRCSNVKPSPTNTRKGIKRCWNRCMPSPEMVHRQLSSAIVETLLAQEGAFEALVAEVRRIVEHGDADTESKVGQLHQKAAELDRICRRLAKALEADGDLEEATNLLRSREAERRQVRAEIDRLQSRPEQTAPLPSGDDVPKLLDNAKQQLLSNFGPEANPLLRRLISRIEARPYTVFDNGELVLRAHFQLRLVGLLPEEWRRLPSDDAPDRVLEMATIPMVVDLFKVPGRIRYAKPVGELLAAGETVTNAARQLGIPNWTAERAAETANALSVSDLTDAYIPVTSMPRRPARWKPRSRPDVFDSEEAASGAER